MQALGGVAEFGAAGAESEVLGGGDFEEVNHARFVAVNDDAFVFFGQLQQFVLLLGFVAQQLNACQCAFHFGNTFKHGLAVGTDALLVLGFGNGDRRAARTAVKQGLGETRADGPNHGRGIEQGAKGGGLHALTGADGKAGQPRGLRHANLCVRNRKLALGKSHVGALCNEC